MFGICFQTAHGTAHVNLMPHTAEALKTAVKYLDDLGPQPGGPHARAEALGRWFAALAVECRGDSWTGMQRVLGNYRRCPPGVPQSIHDWVCTNIMAEVGCKTVLTAMCAVFEVYREIEKA